MTKPIELDVVPVEQEQVGVASANWGLLNKAVPIGTKLYTHPSADQSAEIAKLIQAVADHVTVRAEQRAEIERTEKRLHDVAVACATAEQERDALREQVRVLSDALGAAAEALQYLGGTLHAERCRAALAAVQEPADHIERSLEVVPVPACWQPIETAPEDDTPVDIFADGKRLPDMYRVELSADNVFYDSRVSGQCCVRTATHWMPLPTPPSSPAGEGASDHESACRKPS